MFVVVFLWGSSCSIDRVHECFEVFWGGFVQAAWVETRHVTRLVGREWLSGVLTRNVSLLVAQITLGSLLAKLLGDIVASVVDLGIPVFDFSAESILQFQVSYKILLVIILKTASERTAINIVK